MHAGITEMCKWMGQEAATHRYNAYYILPVTSRYVMSKWFKSEEKKRRERKRFVIKIN
jgi:hypothetical protein